MKFTAWLKTLLLMLWHDERAEVKFDIMGLVFMVVALAVGNMLGPMLGGLFGFGSALIGAFISGIMVYVVYSLILGTQMTIWGAVIFAVCVWISVLMSPFITGFVPILGMQWVALFVQAIVLSVIWSFIAPKQASQAQAPVQV